MNLTSKRMLQFFAGCAGAFAFSATAGNTYVSDNFEYVGAGYGTTNGVANMPISTYKCQPDGTPGAEQVTNYLWYTESSDDLSKLVESAQNYSGNRPIPGSPTNLVLNLETNGKTLVRTNSAAVSFSEATPVYVDTLIKFTPSEDNPTISDAGVKAAVFLDANLHLWVYHGLDSGGASGTTSDTGLVVSTNEWHRLTIMLSDLPGEYLDKVFKVFVDGTPISCAAGMDDGGNPNGPWFYSASVEGTFSSVAFQGTGMVDELVVTENDPFPPPSAIWLTMAFNSAQVDVLTNGIAIANNDSVKDSSVVSIIAKPWYQITDGGALLVNATTNQFTSGAITSIVGTVTGSNGATNTITSASYSATSGLPSGYTDADVTKLIAWSTANGVTPEGLTEAMLDDYLLNVAPGTDAQIKITKITYGTGVVTIEIESTNPGVVDLRSTVINGFLNIYTSDDLISQPFALISSSVITGDTATKQTITLPTGDGKFIRAKIETTGPIL